MNLRTAIHGSRVGTGRPVNYSDSYDLLYNTTMAGSTSLVGFASLSAEDLQSYPVSYVLIAADVILEYERTINELRRDLTRYKTLVAQLRPTDDRDSYGELVSLRPIDQGSVRIVNSIISANVPRSATFVEFDEEES